MARVHELTADAFELKLECKTFEEDMEYPVNTILTVSVCSDGFSAVTTMDIAIKALARFSKELWQLYETLSGKARLEEPYGMGDFIEFQAAKWGYIEAAGVLHHKCSQQQLSFKNEFDQTCLRHFAKELFHQYRDYLDR